MEDIFDLDQYENELLEITPNYVLDQLDDLLIYRHYLGEFILGKPTKSPFRRDTTPSFSIILNHHWLKLMWKDFGTGDAGDCFKLVAKLHNLSYMEAVNKVACDFGLIKGCSVVTKKQIQEARLFKENFQRKEYLIQIDVKDYTEEELQYWDAYGISRVDLIANSIYSIKDMWINKKKAPDSKALRFAYYFPEVDKWKIYSPLSENWKWFGNVSTFQMEGSGIPLQLGGPTKDAIIITKSRKDRIILSKLFKDVISCQNESEAAIPSAMDIHIDSTYKRKFCWFDSDEPGKAANRRLNHRGYKWINVPNELYEKYDLKDPSDVIKHFGAKDGYKILEGEMIKKGII